jgi:hypothetical protein
LEVAELYERAAYAFYRTGRPGRAGACAWRSINRRSAAQGTERWKLTAVLGLLGLGRLGVDQGRPIARRRPRVLTGGAGDDQDEVSSELLQLRSMNQRLRVEVERFEDLRYSVFNLARLLMRAAWRSVRRTGARPRGTDAPQGGSFHVNYTPYTARDAPVLSHDSPRVLHAIANFTTGGSARLVVDLVERLGSVYEQRIITRDASQGSGYRGLPIADYPHLTSARPLQRLMREFRPDIVHVHYVADHTLLWNDFDYRWYIHVFDAAAEAGTKIIENVNIPTAPYRSQAVDRYVFVSDYVRQRYAQAGDNARVIYPGSDLTRFRRSPGG